MSTPINTGGYAFPFTPTDRSGQIADTQTGMTLRDYIAIHASDKDVEASRMSHMPLNEHGGYERTRQAARYAFADAMIAARDTNGGAS